MAHRSKIAVIASYLVVLTIVVFIGAIISCGPSSRQGADESKAHASGSGPKIRPLTDVTFERTSARLKRGEYLAEGVLQCFVCHTDLLLRRGTLHSDVAHGTGEGAKAQVVNALGRSPKHER